MSPVYFWYDKILFHGSKIASDERCCLLCNGFGCAYCIDGVMPPELQVDISGVTNGIYGCTSCDNWNGTYILTIDSEAPEECGMTYLFTDTVCTGIGTGDGGSHSLQMRLFLNSIQTRVQAQEVGAAYALLDAQRGESAPFDCTNWDQTDLPILTYHWAICNVNSATVKVTALW